MELKKPFSLAHKSQNDNSYLSILYYMIIYIDHNPSDLMDCHKQSTFIKILLVHPK